MARGCASLGCGRIAWDGRVCWRCEEEIRVLNRLAEEDAMRPVRSMSARELDCWLRRRKRAERGRAAWAWAVRRIWVAELLLVGGAVAYVGLVYGAAVVDWLAR